MIELNNQNYTGYGIQLGTVIEEPQYSETGTYALVKLDVGDEIYCKQLNPFAGNNFGTRYPLYVGNRVLVAFVDNDPSNDSFILGCLHTEDKPFDFGEFKKNEDRKNVFVKAPEDKKIIETSNNKTIVINKKDDESEDGFYSLFAEKQIKIVAKDPNAGRQDETELIIKSEENYDIGSKNSGIYDSGNGNLVAEGKTIRLGGANAGQNVILGGTLQDILKDLVTALSVAPNSPAIDAPTKQAILGRLNNILSNTVYVTD